MLFRPNLYVDCCVDTDMDQMMFMLISLSLHCLQPDVETFNFLSVTNIETKGH